MSEVAYGSPFLRRRIISLGIDFKPRTITDAGGGGGYFRHVDEHWTVVVSANRFLGAVTIAGLGVHLYCDGFAGYIILVSVILWFVREG